GGEPSLVVLLGVPEPLQPAQLLLADRAGERLGMSRRRPGLAGRLVEGDAGPLADRGGLVPLEDPAPCLLQTALQRVERRAEHRQLFGRDLHRLRELLLRQAERLRVV
ncbi:MAG: hypothetical protein ACK56I_20025, partial [bacterium]